jgi:hypothetical protein
MVTKSYQSVNILILYLHYNKRSNLSYIFYILNFIGCIRLHRTNHEAGAGARKAVYGSVGTVAGTGCHSLLLCGGVFVFLFVIILSVYNC